MAPTREIPEGVLQSDIDHFQGLSLAASTLSDPSFNLLFVSRKLTPDGKGHTLMADTWNTSSTISNLLTFYRHSEDPHRSLASKEKGVGTEIRRFYTFGDGLNSHSNILHGGVLSAIIDSTMSNVAGLGLQRITRDENATVVTAQLTVRFLGAVRTPGSVKISAWINDIKDGRKLWVEAEVEGENGLVANGEGVWIRMQQERVHRERKL